MCSFRSHNPSNYILNKKGYLLSQHLLHSREVVASWLVRSTPDQVVRVRVLAGDIVLCSWASHFTLTVPLSTQVYKIGYQQI